jgi:membrane-associated phospholipid phosphatase
MLKDQHGALLYSLGLLFAMAAVFIAVGRHPTAEAPRTTVEWIGRLDASTLRVMNEIRNTPLSWLALALNVIGSGFVTTPLRTLVGVWLGLRRRWSAVATWLVTWGVSELILASAKSYFHRGRPPHPQVAASGYAFPSGHAVAGAATAVAFVLILMPWGQRRRKWEALAVVFAFVMALSRAYVQAHWLSDVVAGALLGTGVALASAAIVGELREDFLARRARA